MFGCRDIQGPELRFGALLTAAIAAAFGFSGTAQAGSDVALDSAGRIVIAGTSNNAFAIARFRANGALDPGSATAAG